MKKMLYIDTSCCFGHINLNKIYINKLLEEGFDVQLALKEGYLEEINIGRGLVNTKIPKKFYTDKNSSLKNRINTIKLYYYIGKNINIQNFDFIFFSSYDEISLGLYPFNRPYILLNHSNPSGLNNFFKRFFIKLVSRNSIHIVLSERIKQYLNLFGIFKVFVIPIGLGDPYVKSIRHIETLNLFNNKIFLNDFQIRIFCPSGNKYKLDFINSLLNDKEFNIFLRKNKILIISNGSSEVVSKNILVYSNVLSDALYKSLFLESDFILLPYPSSFRLRVSAILYECFSNNKPCFVSDIDSFRDFAHLFNYNPFFNDSSELIKRISAYVKKGGGETKEPFKDLITQRVSFKKIFS